jgi:hypothetical protein
LLAKFANLKPEDAEGFRRRYPNFAPDAWPGGWWNSQVVTESGSDSVLEYKWQEMQRHLHKLWVQRFSPDLCIELMTVGTEWARMSAKHNAQQQAGEEHELRAGSGFDASPKVWDYQRAIMFLYVQPWRASRCEREECRRYFVKEIPARRFCSDTCFHLCRDSGKLKWWHKAGKKQRAQKNKTKKVKHRHN